jgi:dipeptidyl aminopeptidase/acylaminoacyl peptidase
MKGGNIYYSSPGRPQRQLTSNGGDSDPSLSPDGNKVAFVRRKGIGARQEGTQVWIIDLKAASRPSLLLDSPLTIAGETHSSFSKPQFSPDDMKVFALIDYGDPAHATTQAAISVDVQTKVVHFVAPALDLRVVLTGAYEGDLIIQQRRPKVGQGYYFWYYLFDQSGKELGIIGQDGKAVENFIGVYAQ